MNYSEFFKQGYEILEKAETITETMIEVKGGENQDFTSLIDIFDVIGSDCVSESFVDTQYRDELPIFDVYKEHELIKRDMTCDELEEYIKQL